MTWIFSVIGIICVAAIIACYNHVEKLNRIIDERQEDLKRAKAEAERKESKLLVSFSKQTSELRQKLEDMNTDLQITKAQWEWMSKEKNTLTAERDQWKERAEQATAENETLKTFQANATEEIAQLKAVSRDSDKREQLMQELKTAQILYIDDLFKTGKSYDGSEAPSGADVNIAFEIINYRYVNQLRTIVSTEKTPQELLAIDEAVASRIIERARGHVFSIAREPARNYRMRGVIEV